MPRVNIEEEAFGDQRIELLGSLCGYNRFEALGRLAHLWRICTQRGQYIVSDAMVAACLGPNGPAALVTAELGELVSDGIRVRGTDGRIEWVQQNSSTKVSAGRARAHNAPRDARGRLLPRAAGPAEPADLQQATPAEPAESSALLSSLRTDLHPSARAIPPSTEPGTSAPAPSGASDSEADRTARRALADQVWRELEAARQRTAKAVGVELRPLPVMDQGRTALAMRIVEAGSVERARADCTHVLAVREAEAITRRETKWLSGGMFEERSWRTALASSLAEAKRQPARPAAHGPKTLRVQRDDSNDDAPPIRASMRGDNT